MAQYPSSPSQSSGIQWAQVATASAVIAALFLGGLKFWAYAQSGSVAILASLADSLLDLAASVVAFVGVRMAAQPADHNHRFGHGKAEAISSLVQLVLISSSAGFVLIESFRRFLAPEPLAETGLAIGVMITSIVVTIALVGVQTIAIRKTGSMATESDRAHYLGDFLGNAGTLVAVVLAAQFGLFRADAIAGIVTAGFLVWSVFDIGRRALPQLMDEELPETVREDILSVVKSDPAILGVHALRTRRAGDVDVMQMHIELDPDMPLRQAHQIAEAADKRLRTKWPQADIIIHQDVHGEAEDHDAFGQRLPPTPA